MRNIRFIKCEFCSKEFDTGNLVRHLKSKHNKTVKENTLKRLRINEDELPKCKYCNNKVNYFNDLFIICKSKDCKEKLKHENKVNAGRVNALKRVKEGSHPFLKENRELNSEGKDIMTLKAVNKQLKNKTHNFLNENRPKNNEGKDIINQKSYIKNRDDMNKEFIFKNFIKEGKFDILSCMKYFNIANTTANQLKLKYFGHIPQLTEIPHFGKLEKSIVKYIKRLVPSIKIIENDRSIISPKELDIYLPDYNLAIEFDGIYWHSKRGFNYHVNKTNSCETKNIKLLNIFDNEWIDPIKREIWKSVIKQHLGLSKVIYARECKIKSIKDKNLTDKFLDENHLQGKCISKYQYGLFHNNELVSLMTFGKPRFNRECEWELIRFCNKRGVRVVGGASRLLKHFNNNHPGKMISYANRRWSNGKLYESLGFKFISNLNPEYSYTLDFYHLLSRYSCQKYKLPKLLGENFDPNKTEKYNMKDAGYSIIYDCGNKKYILNS